VPPSLRLGKYVVEGLLGPGGVSETYLAHLAPDARGDAGQGGTETLVALKLLRSDRIAEGGYDDVARRFLAAGRQLRDFRRPGFAKVIDLSDDPASTFVVTEHVAGTDLARLVEQSRGGHSDGTVVEPTLAGMLGSEIARLLYVGHSAKPMLCHLGLGPQNVMVMATGEVVLLDCGIAATFRAVTEQPPERWAFVAPELQGVDVAAARLSDRQSVAADLYSLGALVYFLVTGRAPTMPNARTPPPRGAPTRLPDIPGVSSNLGAALRTLLSPEPEDRPESAAMLVDWLAGGVGTARERRWLIAEGLRVAETGVLRASEAPSVGAGSGQLKPPPVKSPGSAGGAAEPVRAAVRLAKPALPRRHGVIAVFVLSLIAGVATLLVFGFRSDRRKPSRGADPGNGSFVETSPKAGDPHGAVARAKGGEERPAPESALGESVLARVAGHLIVETVPPGASVWVDGVLKGKTFADITVGEGGHRIVVIAPGRRMFRDVVDTSRGTIVRRTLVPVEPPTRGNGFIDVECRTAGEFPILIDEEETGLLCPAKMMPVAAGKHMVGIFVPPERRSVMVETTVAIDPSPVVVKFSQ
jgi:hypothetical protein